MNFFGGACSLSLFGGCSILTSIYFLFLFSCVVNVVLCCDILCESSMHASMGKKFFVFVYVFVYVFDNLSTLALQGMNMNMGVGRSSLGVYCMFVCLYGCSLYVLYILYVFCISVTGGEGGIGIC